MLTACTMCACGADSPGAAPTAGALSPRAPSLEALPDCDEMAALLGGLVDGLVPVDDAESGQGKHRDGAIYGVGCTWLTPRAKSDSVFEAVKGGSLAVGITVSNLPADPADDEAVMREMGMIFDDPRAEAVGGYVVTLDSAFDPAAPLGIMGPQLVIGPTTIIITAGGLYLGEVEELAPITNDRAIDASVALYEAIRER
ncbi:lytic murein transglycosylase [Marilutibacter aestuarii]|uniref:Lytic murein transglycosylase n=1 Tax=Marilutibacter aestuarii TaxID=1706195 RepID=A0A508A2H7_9GAMM|nr:lytic murein transglycosylase [Lysobacter aestuarii]TQD42933.1 lytic murein transglycosylase [Lysobacter aestuarii]